jgi:hypothetical protein
MKHQDVRFAGHGFDLLESLGCFIAGLHCAACRSSGVRKSVLFYPCSATLGLTS